MSNRLVLNETSYHGKGAIQEIAGEVKRRGFKKAFVCSGPTIFKHGVTKKVTDVLDQAGCAYEVYTNIKENPTIETYRMVWKNIKNPVLILSLQSAVVRRWIRQKPLVLSLTIRSSQM